jgi:serine/threonine-protein kinase
MTGRSDASGYAPLLSALADRYRVERELGAGGMATVYLAHDLKHDRKVAVKVMKPELGAVLGAERFLREISVMAKLQHPNLLPLFDSGEAAGLLYYVMPYVEGETLRERIARERQLPIDETLRLVALVAGALDYAHAHGVVHRDLKPENILLQAGQPVIADFGIALAVAQAGVGRVTQSGLSLGTPLYMSPEQAAGDRAVDARSDQYSLGALTYEMLTGEPPHTGATAQVIITRLMTEAPRSVRSARPAAAESVDAAVRRVLAKEPADRFSSCGQFAEALRAPARPSSNRGVFLAAGMVGAIGVAAALWLLALRPTPVPTLGRSQRVTSDAGLEIFPAISPDGKLVAYAAGTPARMRIYVRPVAGGRTITLSDDSTSVESEPRWSPDGTQLLFLTRGGVSVAPALGGGSRSIVQRGAGAAITSAAWSPDAGKVAFVQGDSLIELTLAGGAIRRLATGPQLHSCVWSGDARWIACVTGNSVGNTPGSSFGNTAPSGLVLVPGAGGDPITIQELSAGNLSPAWSSDSRRLYFLSNRDGPRDVYTVELSAAGKAVGSPARLTTGLNATSISLSSDERRLAYAPYVARATLWSLPIPSAPPVSAETATQLTKGSMNIEYARVSPDGRWLLYDSDLHGNFDIYRIPVAGGAAEQLTSDPADEFGPDLSPDGRSVAYHSWRTGTRDIEVKEIEGGARTSVTRTPGQESFPLWSPDGAGILHYDQVAPMRLIVARRDAGEWSSRVIASPGSRADWSPDGRAVAYIAANGRPGPIEVVPVAGGVVRRVFQPSAVGPAPEHLVWSPDGLTIYFKAHDETGLTSFWALPSGGGEPRLMVRFPDPERQSSRPYFAADGERFYFTIEDRQSDVFVAELMDR